MGILLIATALVAIGLFTRPAAGGLALFWVWILFDGVRAGQPFYSFPVRDALFVIVFSSMALLGAGQFSADGMRRRGRSEPTLA
jgi:uncharacterized membrane protein YphA (DoxX/SURF4 family)